MPTYKQVVNHVKKHVLWKEEYFERYYRLNPELVQKRLDKIYQAKDDLMVLICTQLFCFLQANGTLYFDGCYKTGKADNSLLCTNLALWSIELACDHFDIREERGHTTKFSEQGESWLTLFACNQFSLVPYCYPAIQRGFQSGVLKEIVPFYREQKLGILAMEIMARERGDTINWEAMQVRVDPVYLDFCQNILLSSDDELVRTGLITLCDKHLEWTDFHNSDKHCCLTGYEIQRQDLLLWPFEYQAVKNWFPCQEPDRELPPDFPAPAWGQNHGSAPGLYRVPDLSVKLATDGYQRGHDYGCSCQVVRVGDNVSAAVCNGVA